MFNWFTRKKEKAEPTQVVSTDDKKIEDAIEESLWEIKERYDLPTEEVITVVELKRRNLEHMHKMTSKKEKYE